MGREVWYLRVETPSLVLRRWTFVLVRCTRIMLRSQSENTAVVVVDTREANRTGRDGIGFHPPNFLTTSLLGRTDHFAYLTVVIRSSIIPYEVVVLFELIPPPPFYPQILLRSNIDSRELSIIPARAGRNTFRGAISWLKLHQARHLEQIKMWPHLLKHV